MERLLRRLHATGLRWVALSLVGLGVAAACSDDAAEPGPKPAVGGEGGESASGSPPVTSGGKTGGGAGTATGGAGGATAGEGGVGGVPHVTTLGEQCTACGATECADTLQSCNDSADCSAWLSCVTACDSSDCVTACDASHADAARAYVGVYDCLCTSCDADCSAAGACDKNTCVGHDPLAVTELAPATLADTGLYETVQMDGAAGAGGTATSELVQPIAIASYVRGFEPKYPLWADGATKDRYVYIPKCSSIDTTDMDHWKFPVGTRFWKAFTVKSGVGAAETVVETRLMHRFGPGTLDWSYAAYQWDVNKPGDPSAAKLVADTGQPNANGTTHDIPSVGQCKQCHNGLEEKVLGFGAFQLSHDTQGAHLTIEKLSNLGWLTTPAPEGFDVPGTPVEQAALGYMHGNCGHCHSEKTPTPAGDPQLLRLMVAQNTLASTDAIKSTVNVQVVSGNAAIAGMDRIEPMDPEHSAVLVRMSKRAPPGLQMPPVGTKVADDDGVKAVTDWINSIPN